jgi:hypothetical protein
VVGPDQRSADIVLEFMVTATEPDSIVLDLHPVACISGSAHVTDFLVLTHDPVGFRTVQGCRKAQHAASGG